ncbi:porin family protein [Chitinophaga skermanii]|nr:porin family protein [Chitinophaga skermanii]
MLLGLFFLMHTDVQAQRGDYGKRYSNEKQFRLGFTLSPLGSFFKAQEPGVERNAGRFGVNFGVMFDYFLDADNHYAISSGLSAVSAGSTLKYDAGKGLKDFSTFPAEYDIRMQYLEIPVSLKLKTDLENDFSLYGQFGTFFQAPIRARTDIITNGLKTEKVNIMGDVNPLNMGLLVGAGVEYPISESLTLTAGLSYQNGFIDVTRNSKWHDGRINNNSFALRLGLFF